MPSLGARLVLAFPGMNYVSLRFDGGEALGEPVPVTALRS